MGGRYAGADDGGMTYFESLIHDAVRRRQNALPISEVAGDIGLLYKETSAGQQVTKALCDPFFPLTLYAKHHLCVCDRGRSGLGRAGQDLALLSRMFLRIRKDIDRWFGNHQVTCVDLNDDAAQEVARGQWCSLCGECCQLPGTVPDPPEPIRYPGYWYAYIAGDSPLIQRFCPFLFELPPQGLFFCAIHYVKPLTCLAFGKEDCAERYPGRALSACHG
jgi:hypothetical protein